MEGLSLEAFQAWLIERAEEWVGMAETMSLCPLAVYLSEREGYPCRVGAFQYGGVEQHEQYPLPLWAQVFATRVDSAYQPGTELSGMQALSLLEWVCATGDGAREWPTV